MTPAARWASIALVALLPACGGPAAGIPADAPDGPAPAPADGGVPPVGATAAEVRDAAPGPGADTAPDPSAGPPPAPDPSEPAPRTVPGDWLCERHGEELATPPERARPPLDCGRVDRLVYWRWTAADGCRETLRLSLGRDGAATLERAEASGPKAAERALDPSEGAALIRDTCRGFNAEHDPAAGIGCPAGSRLVDFFDGEAKAGSTGALPCGDRIMADAFRRLDRLLERF